MIRGNKRKKSAGEDRISALPDCIIQHILSFLPSTKQAIQTGILSKRWRNQWNRLPLLLFDSPGKSDPNFSQFIDQTLMLHDCSKIKKFQIKYDHCSLSDPQIFPKLRFAAKKQVEELILHLSPPDEEGEVCEKNHRLPEFLFNNDSLVKLELFKCYFSRYQSANWPSLKELRLDCSCVCDFSLENILSGCPLLELLEINHSRCYTNPVIASNSLKNLSFIGIETSYSDGCYVKIVCPNLEEMSLKISQSWTSRYCSKSHCTIIDVLSNSPFLRTLEVSGIVSSRWLVFDSQSLKKLVLERIDMFAGIEISCPYLEEFKWCPLKPPSDEVVDRKNLAVKILRQLQHVKSLEIGGWLIQTLKVKDSYSLLLNCECLTLDVNDFDRHLPRIVSVVSCSPLLEKLVIKFRPNKGENALASQGTNDCRTKNNSNSDGVVFNCLVLNLKTVEIIGLSEKDDRCKLVFNLVEFLLKNGRKLEKMVVKLGKCRKRFIFDVSKKLLNLPRCSPNTNIELLYYILCYDCSKIKKFQIKYDSHLGSDPQVIPKIRFAARKQVEELIFHFSEDEKARRDHNHTLPKFLLDNDSLVRLDLFKCYLSEKQSVNWPNLIELRLDSSLLHSLCLCNVLSGCPLLELLESVNGDWNTRAVIASKSLKKLSFVDFKTNSVLITCPNLEELSMKLQYIELPSKRLSLTMIDNVLSTSPFLHTFELSEFGCSGRLLIASKSLKKLVLGRIYGISDLDISCPHLEVSSLYHFAPSVSRLKGNLNSKSLAVKILQQLQHVKLLDIGSWLIQNQVVDDSSSLVLNSKCLTLDGSDFDENFHGILYAIQRSPHLEKLVIKFPINQCQNTVASRILNYRKTKCCRLSYREVLYCKLSNLKTVKITGLSESNGDLKCVFDFVEFLLKNGRVLEKIVVMLADCEKSFLFDVSQKLLSLPRCSPNSTIELCATCPNM